MHTHVYMYIYMQLVHICTYIGHTHGTYTQMYLKMYVYKGILDTPKALIDLKNNKCGFIIVITFLPSK